MKISIVIVEKSDNKEMVRRYTRSLYFFVIKGDNQKDNAKYVAFIIDFISDPICKLRRKRLEWQRLQFNFYA